MNIFKMTDEQFEEYLKLNIDTLNPEKLLADLIECGLYEEEQTYYKMKDDYYEKDNLFDCSYNMVIHRTTWFDKLKRNKTEVSTAEMMRWAA